jgi:hypothetical protein
MPAWIFWLEGGIDAPPQEQCLPVTVNALMDRYRPAGNSLAGHESPNGIAIAQHNERPMAKVIAGLLPQRINRPLPEQFIKPLQLNPTRKTTKSGQENNAQ